MTGSFFYYEKQFTAGHDCFPAPAAKKLQVCAGAPRRKTFFQVKEPLKLQKFSNHACFFFCLL